MQPNELATSHILPNPYADIEFHDPHYLALTFSLVLKPTLAPRPPSLCLETLNTYPSANASHSAATDESNTSVARDAPCPSIAGRGLQFTTHCLACQPATLQCPSAIPPASAL